MADTVKIPGELESVATGNKVVDVANVKDKTKGDKSQFQINTEHEAALSDRYTKEETYNKEEVEQMVTPPSPDYKYYATYAEMIAETSHPAGAIYRVSSYDGTQVDATSYAEYTWNGSEYKLLDVKSQVNEVFDISVYNSDTYDDLADALGEDGENVPDSVKRGGMSVKYVQTSDNKYVQYRLMTNEFSDKIPDWQGIDDVPTAGSESLVKSGGVNKVIGDVILDTFGEFNDGTIETVENRAWVTSQNRSASSVGKKYYKIDITGADKVLIKNVMASIDANIGGMATYGDGTLIEVINGNNADVTIDLTRSDYQGFSSIVAYVNQLIASESKAFLYKDNNLISAFNKKLSDLKFYVDGKKEIQPETVNGRVWVCTQNRSSSYATAKYYKADVSSAESVYVKAVMMRLDANIQGIAFYGDGVLVKTIAGNNADELVDLTASEFDGCEEIIMYVNQLLDSDSLCILYQESATDRVLNPDAIVNEPHAFTANSNFGFNNYVAKPGENLVLSISGLENGTYIYLQYRNTNNSWVEIQKIYNGTIDFTAPSDISVTSRNLNLWSVGVHTTNIELKPRSVSSDLEKILDDNIETIYITATRNAADYNSIREIMAGITDASYYKRYVIVVPEGNWFECDINGKKYVKIQGKDMNRTILYCDGLSSNLTPSDYSITDYANTPLNELAGTFKHVIRATDDIDVENITILSATVADDEFVSAPDITKYCIHLDEVTFAKANFKNCIIKKMDYTNPFPVGIGLSSLIYPQKMEFSGCKFLGYGGGQCVYVHNKSNLMAFNDTFLTIKDSYFNGGYLYMGECGGEYQSMICLNNCYSSLAQPTCTIEVEKKGDTTYWYNKTTQQYETNQLLVPYSMKLNYIGTNVYAFRWQNLWGQEGGNPRPNFLDDCIGENPHWEDA